MAETKTATRRKGPEVGPSMRQSEPQRPRSRQNRPGWCKFKAKGRCYIEGALLEEADQEITLSPLAAFKSQENVNLELIDGTIPTLPEDIPENPGPLGARPSRKATKEVQETFRDHEDKSRRYTEAMADFLDSLEDGDPRVGPPVTVTKLIKQG